MKTAYSEPQTILNAFEKLRTDYQRQTDQIATKEDIATRQKDKELVEQASTSTPDSIFQALAKLQSTFSQSNEALSKEMTAEVEKLAQIQRAIQVENQRLSTLHNIQIAAEALNILQQEHQKTLQSLEQDDQQKHEALEQEMSKQREIGQKQQQDSENAKQKQQQAQGKNRLLETDEYDYKLKWQHTQDTDDDEKRKRALERQLAESSQSKEKDWTEREQYLEKNQAEFDESKAKVESIPKEIEQAMNKTREAAIKDTHKDEENKAKLLEKERESKRKAFELQIESLSKTVEEQKARIAQLTEQLQVASQQMQQLAMTAVSSAGQSKAAEKNK